MGDLNEGVIAFGVESILSFFLLLCLSWTANETTVTEINTVQVPHLRMWRSTWAKENAKNKPSFTHSHNNCSVRATSNPWRCSCVWGGNVTWGKEGWADERGKLADTKWGTDRKGKAKRDRQAGKTKSTSKSGRARQVKVVNMVKYR